MLLINTMSAPKSYPKPNEKETVWLYFFLTVKKKKTFFL